MPRFEVNIPFAGYFSGEVEADNAEAAIAKGMEQVSFRVTMVDDDCFECGEVEVLKSISTGNVTYAPLNSASADKIDED